MICEGQSFHLTHCAYSTNKKKKTGRFAHRFTTPALPWRYFRNPLQSKLNPTPQYFKHSITERVLWIHGCGNPRWVQGELRNGEFQAKEKEEDGEFGVEWNPNKVFSINYIAQHEQEEEDKEAAVMAAVALEETPLPVDGNPDTPQDDIIDAVILVTLLKACAAQKDLHMGYKLHADIVRGGLLDRNVFIGSTLISMYAKCGALFKAQEVFDELLVGNVISWTALIAGYAQHGHGEKALRCYEEMLLKGFSPTAVTFVCALKACGSIGKLEVGEEIHAKIVDDMLLKNNVMVANALVDMYVKCGALAKAQETFDKLRVRDVVTWTTLIAGFAQEGHGEEALSFFDRMQLEGFCPDAFTVASALDACGNVGAADKAQCIHRQIVKVGLLEKDIVVANALVDAYGKCGALEKAQEVFDELRIQDVVSWNSLIAGYAQHGHGKEALTCFEQLRLQDFCPDAFSYAGALKACGSIGLLDKGHYIHAHILKAGLLEREVFVSTSLVDMYAKCGALTKSRELFEQLRVRDIVSWTSLITGFSQHGYGEEALIYFEQMQLAGVSPDAAAFSCILQACGSLGAAYKGVRIHAELVRSGFLDQNTAFGPGLIDMYAGCGMLAEAQHVFDKILVQNVVAWSALMAGYSQLGKDEMVFDLFDNMVREGTKPDFVTFTVLLNSCSHGGLLDKGQVYFEIISKGYDIIPNLEHHTCMVDLFGRAGHLEMAVPIIEEMPFLANLILWHTVLGACGSFGSSNLGRWAYKHAIQLNDKGAAAPVSMSNIYASIGRPEFML